MSIENAPQARVSSLGDALREIREFQLAHKFVRNHSVEAGELVSRLEQQSIEVLRRFGIVTRESHILGVHWSSDFETPPVQVEGEDKVSLYLKGSLGVGENSDWHGTIFLNFKFSDESEYMISVHKEDIPNRLVLDDERDSKSWLEEKLAAFHVLNYMESALAAQDSSRPLIQFQ